jgi:hypothetical protein
MIGIFFVKRRSTGDVWQVTTAYDPFGNIMSWASTHDSARLCQHLDNLLHDLVRPGRLLHKYPLNGEVYVFASDERIVFYNVDEAERRYRQGGCSPDEAQRRAREDAERVRRYYAGELTFFRAEVRRLGEVATKKNSFVVEEILDSADTLERGVLDYLGDDWEEYHD